jgi:hypothetical protein
MLYLGMAKKLNFTTFDKLKTKQLEIWPFLPPIFEFAVIDQQSL